MDWIKLFVEFLLTFLIVFGVYYFTMLRKCKSKKDYVSQEVNLILSFYKIDYRKINIRQMTYIVSILTSFIIAASVTFVSWWSGKLILSLFLATGLSIICMIAIYSVIGRYYLKISKKNSIASNENKNIKKAKKSLYNRKKYQKVRKNEK